jgi:prepilin-type N-terminal cleavage/methylation domain-containing protein
MRCSTIARTRGFTLIELVAALVIAGVLVAIAVPAYQSVRWDARTRALNDLRATMLANMQAARGAYMTQGLGPGNTVQVNGQSIEVNGEGVMLSTYPVPAGSPTGQGMYRMLGCGSDTPGIGVAVPCASLAGHLAYIVSHGIYLWPASTGATWAATWCAVYYGGYVASLSPSVNANGDVDGIGTISYYYRQSDPDPSRAAGAC